MGDDSHGPSNVRDVCNAASVRMSSAGIPTDAPGLVRRYRNALGDALAALFGFGYEADAKEIAERYSLVYLEPKPEVRLSKDVPPAETVLDELAR